MLTGALFGTGVATLLIVGAWLSPLAASDRPTLALLSVTISLPLGSVVGRPTRGLRDAGGLGVSAVVAALTLASSVSIFEPDLWIRTCSWCVAGALVGLSCQSIVRGGGIAATALWLFLCGLPFFYDKIPWYTDTLQHWALEGCPWIGFSADAIGGDPLRRSIIYLGHWTALGDEPVAGSLKAGTLWLAGLFSFASLLCVSLLRPTRGESSEDPAVLERAGA